MDPMAYRLDVYGFYPLNGFLLSEEPAEPASWETSLSTNSSDWQNCFTFFFLHVYLDDKVRWHTPKEAPPFNIPYHGLLMIFPSAGWTIPNFLLTKNTPPVNNATTVDGVYCNQQYLQDSIYLNISVGQHLSHNYQVNVYVYIYIYIYVQTSGTMWRTSHVLISIMTHVSI